MKFEDEALIKANYQKVCDYVFDLNNLSFWLDFVNKFSFVTIYQEKIGSTMNIEIDLFNKTENFYFKISEFEKNKKIKLKSKSPFLFEISLKLNKSIENQTFICLKTKFKHTNFLEFGKRKKIVSSTRISLKNLENIFEYPSEN